MYRLSVLHSQFSKPQSLNSVLGSCARKQVHQPTASISRRIIMEPKMYCRAKIVVWGRVWGSGKVRKIGIVMKNLSWRKWDPKLEWWERRKSMLVMRRGVWRVRWDLEVVATILCGWLLILSLGAGENEGVALHRICTDKYAKASEPIGWYLPTYLLYDRILDKDIYHNISFSIFRRQMPQQQVKGCLEIGNWMSSSTSHHLTSRLFCKLSDCLHRLHLTSLCTLVSIQPFRRTITRLYLTEK